MPILIALSLIISNKQDGDAPEFKFNGIFFFSLFLIFIGVVSLMYLLKRIHWLLVQKDIELRHHSTKSNHEDLNVKLDESQGSFKEEREFKAAPILKDDDDVLRRSTDSSYLKRNQMC